MGDTEGEAEEEEVREGRPPVALAAAVMLVVRVPVALGVTVGEADIEAVMVVESVPPRGLRASRCCVGEGEPL